MNRLKASECRMLFLMPKKDEARSLHRGPAYKKGREDEQFPVHTLILTQEYERFLNRA